MEKVSFLLGVHNHQPIGNFDEVFKDAYQKSYAPFLKVLLNHPSVKWSLHCTGILWDWLEKYHPEYIEDVQTMVKRNQIELLSGGYYEPILPVLPDVDKVGQIQKLNRYLKERFHVEPQGMWCAERVWEPHLPKAIRQAQIHYTILDDAHFLSAGLSPHQLNGYFKVEEQNDSIDIFPISQELRYAIPFSKPENTIELLGKCADTRHGEYRPVLVMADDGEKFGFWPETYKSVYEEKWLERFLTLLEKNSDWIKTETFSQYRKENKAAGKIFLPTASYFEMTEWSLPADSGEEFEEVLNYFSKNPNLASEKRFLKGGFWRNFLTKYPEADSMYKKMLRVSQKVHKFAGDLEQSAKSKTKKMGSAIHADRANFITRALDYLWAGQCNCSYWHGVFGGLYLPVLRQAIYKNLLDAERVLDAAALEGGDSQSEKSKKPLSRIEVYDFDNDGNDEIIVETPVQNLYLAPSCGGTMFEWDFKPRSVNLLNVLTRRKETYHKKLKNLSSQSEQQKEEGAKSIHELVNVKESGLESIIQYDWYRRANLIDHFPHPTTSLESFKKCQYGEQGDFVLGRYECEILTGECRDKKGKKDSLSILWKSAEIGSMPKENAPTFDTTVDHSLMAIRFSRDGIVWAHDKKREVRVEKTLQLPTHALQDEKALLRIFYRIVNSSHEPVEELCFAPEFNFAFSIPKTEKDIPFTGCKRWERADRHLYWKVAVDFSDPSDGWVLPLETVSNSESGFEKTFQGLVFVPFWKFSLDAESVFERSLTLTVAKI